MIDVVLASQEMEEAQDYLTNLMTNELQNDDEVMEKVKLLGYYLLTNQYESQGSPP